MAPSSPEDDKKAPASEAPRRIPPSGSLARGLAALALLAEHPQGLSLGSVAATLGIPKAAAHRSLSELMDFGFAQQPEPQGDYSLGLKFVSLALRYLSQTTLVDLARPALQRLANASEELVRFCLIEDNRLYWVDKRQGAKTGLRFDDPDMGAEVRLGKSATGIAWLAALPESEALEMASEQDARWSDTPVEHGELLERIHSAQQRGFAFSESTYEIGLAGMAVPVIPPGSDRPVALLSIAGPSVRFTLQKAEALAPLLHAEAKQLASLTATV